MSIPLLASHSLFQPAMGFSRQRDWTLCLCLPGAEKNEDFMCKGPYMTIL